ncbi:hypothetical protein ACNQFZ_09705 [Schinkia sp. CFF1]
MFKDVIYYYNLGILKILGFTSLIVLPFQLFMYGWIHYFSQLDLDYIENLLVLYMYVLLFIATQKPFSKLYRHLRMDEEYSLKSMVHDFVSSFGFVFFGGIIVFVFSYIGTVFFVIPGLVILSFAFLLPFYEEDDKTLKATLSKAKSFYRQNFISIFGDILLWTSVNMLIWAILMNGLAFIEVNLMIYTVLRIVINLFLFPIIYFYVTEKYVAGN